MRYYEVSHTYVVVVDEGSVGDPTLDSVINSGVSMMEAHMRGLFNDNREIRSDWKLMPREYQPGEVRTQGQVPAIMPETTPRPGPHGWEVTAGDDVPQLSVEDDSILSKRIIENDLDQGISFAQDIMGQGAAKVTHPWDQGLSIFPDDHPLREVEDHMRAKRDKAGLEMLQAKSPKLKEIEAADDEN